MLDQMVIKCNFHVLEENGQDSHVGQDQDGKGFQPSSSHMLLSHKRRKSLTQEWPNS